jgi:beta-glucosidase
MTQIDDLLAALTLEEKARLTAGEDMMSTPAIERLGVPKVNVTDGPNGARGPLLPGAGGPSSSCIPCGSAIGAAWDVSLAEALGGLVGKEALDRGCRVLLAPTLNLHRSPLAGRNFECYSEDPLLAGRMGAAFVRGVQRNDVIATVKHFVGNEAEFERGSINSVIDERTLRELYLLPFELAIRDGGALGLMTAYNRVNGKWLTEQRAFLTDLVRDEWGFEGLVMTDWFGVVDTVASIAAGLDLEMPGAGRAYGRALADAVQRGDVDPADLDAAVRRILTALDRVGALSAPTPQPHPAPPDEAEVALMRRAAAAATVLLRNDGTLPLDTTTRPSIAIIGHHASSPTIMGGGSAQVAPQHVARPVDALVASLAGAATVVYERGTEPLQSPATIGHAVLVAADGFTAERFADPDLTGEPTERTHLDSLRMINFASALAGAGAGDWSMRVRGTVVAEEDGELELALAQCGAARVLVDGVVLLDGVSNPPPPGGSEFFGMASQDLFAPISVVRGRPMEIVVEYTTAGAMLAGFRVGYRTPDSELLMRRAVEAARSADVAVVFVGTTEDTETEGRDRSDLALPGRQDELVRSVASVNRRTVVVVNAAAPVDLPWEQEVAAVVQCWFGGQEMGAAVADVLLGAEPGGRLPMSIPFRLEHSPSFDNFPGENGEVLYGERVFMGYRGHDHRASEPRHPFGFGLSYTSFEIGAPVLSAAVFQPGQRLTVAVPITNTGTRAGSEVVQCYVAPPVGRLARPLKELKAFAKVTLGPGETTTVELVLDDRSFAYWDPGQPDWDQISPRVFTMFGTPPAERRAPGWQVDPGRYELVIGRSSADIVQRCSLEVAAATGGAP